MKFNETLLLMVVVLSRSLFLRTFLSVTGWERLIRTRLIRSST